METSCKWAIWGHLLIADGTETSGAACDSHTRERFVLMTLSAFCNSQEVLRCGRSFEVEKLLSDERYQTFKVSRQKQKAPLSFCFSHFCRSDIGPNRICICYLLRTWYFDCPLPLQPEPPPPPHPSWEEHVISESMSSDYVLTSFPASCSQVCLGLDPRRLTSGTAEGCAHSARFWQTAAFISTRCSKLVHQHLSTFSLALHKLQTENYNLHVLRRRRGAGASFVILLGFFWSHRRLLMRGAGCDVFSLKRQEMWPSGSLQWKHYGGENAAGLTVTAEGVACGFPISPHQSARQRSWEVADFQCDLFQMLNVFVKGKCRPNFLWGMSTIKFIHILILDEGVATISRAVLYEYGRLNN